MVRDNKDEVITSQLPELKNVRFIRVYPTEWYDAIAIRMEIYGCMKGRLFQLYPIKRLTDLLLWVVLNSVF